MRVSKYGALASCLFGSVLVLQGITVVEAFVSLCLDPVGKSSWFTSKQQPIRGVLVSSSNDDSKNNCGCDLGETIFAGEPSAKARALDPRKAMRGIPFRRCVSVNDEFDKDSVVTMEDLLPSQGVSIVVLLRSLG